MIYLLVVCQCPYLSIDDLDQREQQLPVHLPIAREELVRVNELVAEQEEPATATEQ